MREASFGSRLLSARERRDLSAVRLADLSTINATTISHFERDKREPSAANIRKLAQALDISADYLLGLSDETNRLPRPTRTPKRGVK